MPLGDYLKTFEIRPNAGAAYEQIRVSGFDADITPISRTGNVQEELWDKRLVQMIDGWRLMVELSWERMTHAQAENLVRLIPDMVASSDVRLRFPDAGGRALPAMMLSDVEGALQCVFEERVRNKRAGFSLVNPQPMTTAEVAALSWLLK